MTKKKESTKKPRSVDPWQMTPEKVSIILDNVRSDLSLTNAARIAKLSPQTPHNWITCAKADMEAGLESMYTKFYDDFLEAQGLKVREFMRDVASMNKGWQAVAWLLEKCCAEDFGKESELYKQLLDDYKNLMQSLIDQNKGSNNGYETTNSKAE